MGYRRVGLQVEPHGLLVITFNCLVFSQQHFQHPSNQLVRPTLGSTGLKYRRLGIGDSEVCKATLVRDQCAASCKVWMFATEGCQAPVDKGQDFQGRNYMDTTNSEPVAWNTVVFYEVVNEEKRVKLKPSDVRLVGVDVWLAVPSVLVFSKHQYTRTPQ